MSINNIASIQVKLASPERIHEWSHGEVKKPETINYRSQKPERDGLFCERIFGPTKDWECYCGKYKKVRYKGVICDRCGVEITKSTVRRERMGHIELAAPVAHIWYLRGIPSRMALLLDVTPKQLEEVVYFVSWIVTDPRDTKLEYKQVLSEKEYRENMAIYGPGSFVAQTGAEAALTLLKDVDLEKEYKLVKTAMENAQGEKHKKLVKRLDTIEAFRRSGNKPGVDGHDRRSGHTAGSAPDAAAGWRPIRDQRSQRSLPPRHHPQQPSEEAARARYAGHHRAE